MTDSTMSPPGAGTWELDAVHFPRPVSPILRASLSSFAAGMAEATARYGLLLDRIVHAEVDGWLYQQARPVGAPPGARRPPRALFHLLSRLHPAFRRRARTARTVFADRPWRADLERWEGEVKPEQVRRHHALLAEPLSALPDDQLLVHLERCVATHASSMRLHGYFSIPAVIPIADLIAHVEEWTGVAAHELLAALASRSPISGGREPAREALVRLLREDGAARAVLFADERPERIVEGLRGLPGDAGAIARAYLDSAGYRILSSYDLVDPYALEVPFVIVESLRRQIDHPPPDLSARASAVRERIREAVPAAHRPTFDEIFQEAALVAGLRDERVLFNDAWSAGVTRRALLEVGRRLVARQLLDDPQHATACEVAELRALLLAGAAPPDPSPADRWRRHRTASIASVPELLGPAPLPPPPATWLPAPLRRGHRATVAGLAAVFLEGEGRSGSQAVKGFGVSSGVYQGRARVVLGPDEFHLIRPGDVLVARFTSPAYNMLLPLLGAIVTDRGGALSHAAIVSREFGIPGVVGCRDATRIIPDGATVLVDGDAGECRVVS